MQSSGLDIQTILECAICNEILCNPRTLMCEHSFCKECIDNTAKFKEDSITIKCPLCEKEDVLKGDLSNLKPPLVLKQLLDLANRYHLFRSWCSFQEASSLLFFLRSDFTADITLAIFETFIDSF